MDSQSANRLGCLLNKSFVVVKLISAGDLIKLYSAVQSSADAEEKRRRAGEFDDAVSANIRELFSDPKYPKRRRSFGAIRKSFGGYFDDNPNELRKHLIRIGASHKRGDGDDAFWHLPINDGKNSWTTFTWSKIGAIAAIASALIALFEFLGIGPSGWFSETSEIEKLLGRK